MLTIFDVSKNQSGYKINKLKLKTFLESKFDKGIIYRIDTKTLWYYQSYYWHEFDQVQFESLIHKQTLVEDCEGKVSNQNVSDAYAWLRGVYCDNSDSVFGDGGVFARRARENAHIIPCAGNYIDAESMSLIEAAPAFYKTTIIPFNIDTDFDMTSENCPQWIKLLNEIYENDTAKIQLVKEMFGYCLLSDNRFENIFVMLGNGGTGKSQVLMILQAILNGSIYSKRNTSSVGAENLADTHSLSSLVGKYANVCDENPRYLKASTQVLKGLSSGNTIQVNPKFKDAFPYEFFTKLVFSMNERPNFGEDNNAIDRRMIYIQHNVDFSKSSGRVLNIARKIAKDELIEIFKWSVQGLNDLLSAGCFTIPTDSLEIAEEIKMENNPLRQWLEECVVVYEIDENDCRGSGSGSASSSAIFASSASLIESWHKWSKNCGVSMRYSPKGFAHALQKIVGKERNGSKRFGNQVLRGFNGLAVKSTLESDQFNFLSSRL